MIIENERLRKIESMGKTYKYLEPLLLLIPIIVSLLSFIDYELAVLFIGVGLVFIIIFRIAFLTIKQNAIISLLSNLASKASD